MKEKLKEIISHYKKIHKSGLNLRYFDCGKSAGPVFNDFKNEIRQVSMFEEKKLLIITNSFSNPDFKEKFLKESKQFLSSDNTILIYEQEEIRKNNSLFKFLKENAKCQEFEPLSGQKLKSWVKKEFKKYKIEIAMEVIEKLCEYVGNDLWRMSNEIRKLASFKPKEIIKVEDIRALIKPKVETDIFKTIDAIAQKDKKQALKLLHKHLEKGDSPLYLLSMINFQFRNLLIVKDFMEHNRPYNVILKKSGLHPFVVKKSYYQSQKFSFQELKKIYRNIFQVDLDIKIGKIEPEAALDILIAEI